MSLGRIVTDGLIAIVPFSLVVWATFLTKPRLWLHSLPPDIQAMAPPKTADERRLTGVMGTFVLLCFFGVPIFVTWRGRSALPDGLSLLGTFAHLYSVWMIVNLWDLIGMDWPYAWFVDPDRPPIPGTAGARGYKDFGFHLRAFFKASVFGLAIIIPAALLIFLSPRP